MKIIKFKAKRTLHDSGYRHIKVTGENDENLGEYHDVIHIRLGGALGTWFNIDCQKDGTFRIFTFPTPEGPELEPEGFPFTSSFFVDVKGNIRIDKRDKEN